MYQSNDTRHEDAIQGYIERGYVTWPEPVSADLLQCLSDGVDAIQSNATRFTGELQELLLFERDLSKERRGGVEGEAVGDAIFIIGDPVRFDPVFQALVEGPVVKRAAKALLGTDEVVMHFINVTIKQPRFGRSIGWHRDYSNAAYTTENADFLRLMLCIDGMDERSGATSFVPGSHEISDVRAAEEKAQGRWPQPTEGEICCLTCGAGEIVAIHPKVLHGGAMNVSERNRRNVVMQIGKASALLTTDNRESVTGFRL